MLFLWNLSSNIWLLGSIWYDEAHAKYIWETICLSLSFCRRLGRQLAVSGEKPNTWHLMPGRGTAGAWTLLLLDLVSTAQLFLSVGISVWEKENHCLLWSKCFLSDITLKAPTGADIFLALVRRWSYTFHIHVRNELHT